MASTASMRFVASGLLLAGLSTAACGGASGNAPPVVLTGGPTAEDDAMAALREHDRYHHHGGVTLLIAMSLDTLGVSPEQVQAVEEIRLALHARMEPARLAEQGLVGTLADGLASGSLDPPRVRSAVASCASFVGD